MAVKRHEVRQVVPLFHVTSRRMNVPTLKLTIRSFLLFTSRSDDIITIQVTTKRDSIHESQRVREDRVHGSDYLMFHIRARRWRQHAADAREEKLPPAAVFHTTVLLFGLF